MERARGLAGIRAAEVATAALAVCVFGLTATPGELEDGLLVQYQHLLRLFHFFLLLRHAQLPAEQLIIKANLASIVNCPLVYKTFTSITQKECV